MDSDKLAFWGIALKPGEPADLDLQDGEALHVTMASFGVKLADPSGRSVVTARVANAENNHALAVLSAGGTESRVMDVSFIGEESITFEVTGKNVVHLVGNFSFEDDDDSDDSDDEGEGLIGLYDDDGDLSDDDEEDEPKLVDSDPPVITELSDDDEQPKNKIKALTWKEKKDKVPNGKSKGQEKKMSEDVSKSKKNEGKAVSFKNRPEKAMSSGDEEGEGNDEMDEEDVAPQKVKQMLSKKSPKKASVSASKKVGADDEDNDNVVQDRDGDQIGQDSQASPKNSKKRRKKRKTSLAPADEPTPPASKKSKISDRPGTPAAIKSGSRPSEGETTPIKDNKKGKQMNGNADVKTPETTPVQDRGIQGTGSLHKSDKRKKRKAKKGGAST